MTTSVMSRVVLGSFLTLGLLAGTPASAQGNAEAEAKLEALMANGKLMVEPVLETPLEDGRFFSIVRVELLPGVTEPHHTHPGLEVLYGLGGSGAVAIDGGSITMEAGTVVQVDAGQTKALSNPSRNEPLQVLAVLILEADKAPLTIVDQSGRD